MKINKITQINFKSKIIDSHTHIGEHNGVELKKEHLDVFVKSELPNKDTVEKMFVSSVDVLHKKKSEYAGNNELLRMLDNSDKYRVLVSCSPENGSVNNIKLLFKENPEKIIGLKFHSQIQNLPLNDKRYEPYLEFANKEKIPCLFHSSVPVDNSGKIIHGVFDCSHSESIYTLAKKYKDTPIIMAHLGAGWNESHDKTVDIIISSIRNNDANLYADISWVDIDKDNKDHVVRAIKRLKGIGEKDWKYGDQSFRLMFGTDAPIDRFHQGDSRETYSSFVESIKKAIRNDNDLKFDSEKIIDDLFYNNAQKLYIDNNQSLKPKINSSEGFKLIKNTTTKIFLFTIALIGALGGILYSKKEKTENYTKNNFKN